MADKQNRTQEEREQWWKRVNESRERNDAAAREGLRKMMEEHARPKPPKPGVRSIPVTGEFTTSLPPGYKTTIVLKSAGEEVAESNEGDELLVREAQFAEAAADANVLVRARKTAGREAAEAYVEGIQYYPESDIPDFSHEANVTRAEMAAAEAWERLVAELRDEYRRAYVDAYIDVLRTITNSEAEPDD